MTDLGADTGQYYKVVKGDGKNSIVGGDYQNATFAQKIVEQSHGYWEDLVKGKSDANKIKINQTSHPEFGKSYIESKKATKAFKIPKKSNIRPAKPKPEEFNQWYYLDADFNLIELPGQ